MKVYSLEAAAERMGVSSKILEVFEAEGKIQACERVGNVPYFSQIDLDSLIQDLHCTFQRANWREVELRLEDMETRIDDIERRLREMREASSRRIV